MNGHWKYHNDINPQDWFGFIYRIIDLDTGKQYIGKKQFWSTTRRAVKGKVHKKKIIKESDWKSYTSSSIHINREISERGKDRFEFYIESLHKSKAALHYTEVEVQVLENVLREKLPNGERKYYNGMIANIKFIPPIPSDDETKSKIKLYETNITTVVI